MFEQSFVSNGKARRSWTVLVAFAGQVVVIGLLLAIPMFFIESLPMTQFSSVLLAPPPPPPPPPPAPPAQARVARATQMTPRKFDMRRLIAPKTIPKEVATVKDCKSCRHRLPMEWLVACRAESSVALSVESQAPHPHHLRRPRPILPNPRRRRAYGLVET